MNLLAIETATDACSVALQLGNECRVDHRIEPRRHAQLVLPMIDALLAEAGLARGALGGVAFGRGPGSFTGVRVAASVTQGIALGLDIGVVGVSTLATIAQGCLREFGDAHVGVALDARLDEVYWGAFRADASGVMHACVEERVCLPGAVTFAPDAVTLSDTVASPDAMEAHGDRNRSVGETGVCKADDARTLAGAGAERYADTLFATLGVPAETLRPARLPNARDTLALARARVAERGFGPPESAVPVYLRERVAATEAERGIVRDAARPAQPVE